MLLSKELETVAEQMGDKIRILKIDCDKNEQISSALQIQGEPDTPPVAAATGTCIS